LNGKLNRLVAAACCASLIGCTTLTPVGLGGAAQHVTESSGEVPPATEGDVVIIELKDGRRLEGRLEKIGSEFIEIRAEGAQALTTVQRDQLVAVSQRRFSLTKTALLVAGITLGLYAYAYSRALVELLRSW
jgi:hypothetical protein